MRLILVRHAETESNLAGVLDTRIPGSALSALGERQAEDLVDTLVDESVDAIFASTQVRTQHSAAPLAKDRGLAVTILDSLREITAGSLEMLGDVDSIQMYLSTLELWVDGRLSWNVPGGETGAEFLERFDDAVNTAYESAGETAVVFSHGGAIRTWASIRAVNINRAVDLVWDLANVEFVALEGSPTTGWFLKA